MPWSSIRRRRAGRHRQQACHDGEESDQKSHAGLHLIVPSSEPVLTAAMMCLCATAGKAWRHHQYVREAVPRSFAQAVQRVVRDLARGEVVSYGEVARRAGSPRAARAVGNVLASCVGVPWWRVVRANGELAANSRDEQARRLRREGVSVRDGRVRGLFR